MPWVRQVGSPGEPCLVAMGGPDAVALRGALLKPIDHQHRGELTVAAGEVRDLQLTWFPSHLEVPPALEVEKELGDTKAWWQDWADRISHDGPHRDEVVRSLLILRALTNHENRRYRRRGDDGAARGDRGVCALGLPLRLAARCRPHARGAARPRLPRRGRAVAGMVAAGRRRRPRRSQIMYGPAG